MTQESFVHYFSYAVAHLLTVLALSFILWMAVDAAKGDKYLWVVLILGLPVIGALIYFFVEKEGDYMKLSKEEQEK